MLLETAALVLGFVFLIKGADVFVDASVNIAARFGIPSAVIGLTIVSLGTTAPEMVVSITAAFKGSDGMAVSNAVGSNIFNIMAVVGVCACIRPIPVKFNELKHDFAMILSVSLLFLAVMSISDEYVHGSFGYILVFVFIVYISNMVLKTLKRKNAADEETKAADKEKKDAAKPLVRSILFAGAGAAVILAGGQLSVYGGSGIAARLGVTERVIGLTVLAVGTSLPELVVSLVACKKGEGELALGNAVGASIFNMLILLGLVGIISPLPANTAVISDLALLTLGAGLLFVFARTKERVSRSEGAVLFGVYASYMVYSIIGG